MTPATWLLLLLALATAFECVAFALPARNLAPHPFVTDPTDLAEGEHIGVHEAPGSREGETHRLWPGRLR